MCKKNFIPISIGFCVIPLQSYREILKKYIKRTITLQKEHFFQKNWETGFETAPSGILWQSFEALGWTVWLQSNEHTAEYI